MIRTICERNNSCETINCNECETNFDCCNSLKICAMNASTKTRVEIKVDENKFNSVLKKSCVSRSCNIKKDNYKIVNTILLGLYVYIFVQLKYSSKENILCVVQGQVDKCNIVKCDTLIMQMYYNLYNAAKNACVCKQMAKQLHVTQVIYSTYNDLFIVLFEVDNKTMIGKIEHYESMHTVGTSLNFIKTEMCDVLVIEHVPQCIRDIAKGKYNLTVYDECKKYTVSYTVCF